jgi:hypothetical protein
LRACQGDEPTFHLDETASFVLMINSGIRPEMLRSAEFGNMAAMAILRAAEKQKEYSSDFCAATWKLFGPSGPFRQPMLAAN